MKVTHFPMVLMIYGFFASLTLSCEFKAEEAISCIVRDPCGNTHDILNATLSATLNGFNLGLFNFEVFEHIYVTCFNDDKANVVNFVIGNGQAEVGCCPKAKNACKFPHWIKTGAHVDLVTMRTTMTGDQSKCAATFPSCSHDGYLLIESNQFECPNEKKQFIMISVNGKFIGYDSEYVLQAECMSADGVELEIGLSTMNISQNSTLFCEINHSKQMVAKVKNGDAVTCHVPCCNQSEMRSLTVGIYNKAYNSYTHNDVKLQCHVNNYKNVSSLLEPYQIFLIVLALLLVFGLLLAAMLWYLLKKNKAKDKKKYEFDFKSANQISGEYPIQRPS